MLNLLFFILTSLPFSFSHLDVGDGLSQSSVFAINQDSRGFVWFGTYDGLCRFDGNEIDIFRHHDNDPTSISGNIIRQLLVDSSGYIWAATNKGFSRLDPTTDRFENIDIDTEDLYVFTIAEVDENHIVAKTSSNFYVIDRRTNEVTSNISDFGIENEDYYFKRIPEGILVVSKTKTGSLISILGKERKRISEIPFHSIRIVTASRDSCLYFGSEGSGFIKVDRKTGNWRSIPLRSRNVRALCSDTKGNVWIGTANNLFVYSPDSDSITEITPDSSNPEAVSNASIRSLFCDSSGGIWAGTFFGGVNYYNPWKSGFESIRYPSPDKDIVGCLSEDDKGNLWVGTFRDGVLKYDLQHNSYRNPKIFGTTTREETKDVKSIVFSGNRVFIGMEKGGLAVHDLLKGYTLNVDSKGLFESVYSIQQTISGSYWLGTSGGLFLFDFRKNILERIPDFKLVRKIHKAGPRDIWLGGDGFLARCLEKVDEKGTESLMTIKTFENISWVQDINSIGEYVWICTRNGLFRYSIGRDSIEKVDLGSENISVKAIEDGGNGKLWLSAEDGLYCFDTLTGRTRHYGKNDGLVCSAYTIGARERLSDGSIAFGGIDGITRFHPADIIPQTYTPLPVIKRISLDGEKIDITSDRTAHIRSGNSIISIKFTSPDFVSWKNVSYKYTLEGFEDKWHDADISRTATYSNLPKGRYCFKVVSTNADGIRSASPDTICIRVHPAWYQTTAFIIALILLILAAVSYFIYDHIRDIQRNSTAEIEGLKLQLYSGPKAEDSLSEEDARFLKKALKTVNDNLSNEGFTAEMFAKEMGLSRTGLHSRLKTITGESALEFIKKVRFNEACSLLRKGGLTIAQVGYKVGYSSPAYFTSSFKKRIGKTPKEYMEITGRSR